MSNEKKSFTDKLTDIIIDKIATPMGKVASLKTIQVIKDGLVGVMPVVLIGSMFLLVALLGQPVIGNTGEPLIKALSPYQQQIGLVNSLTMGLMAFYAAIAFSVCYAKVYDLDVLTMTILGSASFILFNINKIVEASIGVGSFGASGMFTAMISTFFAGYVYKTCIRKNLVIKMPKGIPQGIGNAFSALIPFLFVFLAAWALRTLANVDLSALFVNIFKPIFSAADNIVIFTLRVFIAMAFWSVGIHGDNILGGIIDPLKLMWVAENAEAAQNGVPLNQLPYIWTTGLERCVMYTAALWGLVFWLYVSKRRNNRILAIASTPASIFCIIEPIVFGLPVVMNPMVIVPWILSGTIAAFVGYGIMMTGLVNRFFIELPWATPAPIIAVVGTGGDWKALLLVIQAVIVGIVVYMPFMKALEKQQEEEALLETEADIEL